ncbi:hypothetical protein Sango_2801500 [Sesamum angolense]|uniref:Retrovirus-related Pol polyprotein from transposon TNT 1-94-like beta-barrel domain-containing protein n=1 Tax=Sesamum angolense TaxID=2727404 RepID=A0AAE1T6L6_9LAMI|nr:hypothetical protein Sango_2801500 [Sesamum angolense]
MVTKLLIFFEQLDVDYVLFTTPPEPDVHTETSSVALTPVTYEGTGNVKMKYDRDNKTSEYRNHLKHKKKDLNLQELISHMRTEEANRLKDEEISNSSISFKANLVESSPSRKDRLQPKGKKFQKGGNKRLSKEAMEGSTKNKSQTTISTKTTNQSNEQEEVITAVVVEANLIENKKDWILDTGASKHFCSHKELFQDFQEACDGECLHGQFHHRRSFG